MTKKTYHIYLVKDSIFDKFVWEDTKGIECDAFTGTNKYLTFSVFRLSHFPKKYRTNRTVSVRTLMNDIIPKRFLYDLILHEVAGHGILNLEDNCGNSVMADGLRDNITLLDDRESLLKAMIKKLSHIKIHVGVIPV